MKVSYAGLMLAAAGIFRFVDSSCDLSAVDGDALLELEMYDKDVYLEAACFGGPPLPTTCNYMGLGQGCSDCFMTCAGATKYMKDVAEEVDEWGASTSMFADALVNFCPNGEVELIDECNVAG